MEVEELEQRVQQLATENEPQHQAEQQSREREMVELRRQLQSLQMAPQSTTASPAQKVRTVTTPHTVS